MTTIKIIFKILFLILITSNLNSLICANGANSTDENHEIITTNRRIRSRRLIDQDDQVQTVPEVATTKQDLEIAELVTGPNGLTSLINGAVQPATATATNSNTNTATSASSTSATSKSPSTSAIEDEINFSELCYLSSGGSSVTLIVNEATQIGSIIGQVEVNGEPSLDSSGNIDLLDGATSTFEPSAATNNSTSSQLDNFLSSAATTTTTTTTTTTSTGNYHHHPHGLAHSIPGSRHHHRRLLGRRAALTEAASGSQQQQQHRPGRMVGPPPPATSFYSLIASSAPTQATPQDDTKLYSLRQTTPVRLEPGTKNLVLTRQLDKESVEGETSLLVNVKCRPRRQSSASSSNGFTVIPIRLLITDANDHAPEFVFPPAAVDSSSPPPGDSPEKPLMYVINISETAPVGSIATRDILAIDKDSTGPHSTIHYKVLQASASLEDSGQSQTPTSADLANLFAFSNPLEPTLFVAAPLDFETQPQTFTLTILAQDQAEPEPLSSTAQVQVNLIDFDDQNPKFLDEKYSLLMDDSQASSVGQNLRVWPRSLRAEDGDRGIMSPIQYSFDLQQQEQLQGEATASISVSAQGESPLTNIDRYLHLNPSTGELRLIRQWPSQSQISLTLVVRATQVDNKDRYALTTLTITSGGQVDQHQTQVQQKPDLDNQRQTSSKHPQRSNQQKVGLAFVQDRLLVNLPEDTPPNERIARVRANYLGGGGGGGGESSTGDNHQAVDLITTTTTSAPLKAGSNNNNNRQRQAAQSTPATRPINYQILDDQMDSFSINPMGEIQLKRALDYEQKQQFKFRVLATYTKYSDICQVQVNVVNVNDNKPKFVQSQYTIHLNEARLRSNLIGQVQAHDADLNDTLKYSIVSTTCQPPVSAQTTTTTGNNASAFFVMNSSTGQLSLKPGLRQLMNVTSCQLIVQVQDSLPTSSKQVNQQQSHHSHQSKVILHVAPQILGRSINFDSHQTSATTAAAATTTTTTTTASIASPSSISLITTNPNHHNFIDDQQHQQRDNKWLVGGGSGSGGSPHVAQVAPGSGRQQQPVVNNNQRSTLATVMASLQHMTKGVNFFEMPMSSALLLSALLAFMICLLLIVIVSMSLHVYKRRSKWRRRRHLAATAHLRHAHLAAALSPPSLHPPPGGYDGRRSISGSESSSSSPSGSTSGSSPTTCGTVASGRPSQHHHQQQHSPPQQLQQQHQSIEASNAEAPELTPTTGVIGVEDGSLQSRPSGRRFRDQLGSRPTSATATATATGDTGGRASLISSLSSGRSSSQHKASSYRLDSPLGATSDDSSSSVMNCGHYSVNGTIQSRQVVTSARRASQSSEAAPPPSRRSSATPKGPARSSPPVDSRQTPALGEPRSSIEAAIRSLVRKEEEEEEDDNGPEGEPANTGGQKAGKLNDELSILTAGKPGIKSYRRLPLMNSLVRPVKSQLMMAIQNGAPNNRVAPMDLLPSSPPAGQVDSHWPNEQSIRWPSEAIPQRVKKLTWDDELSCATAATTTTKDISSNQLMYLGRETEHHFEAHPNDHPDDCYISPDVILHSPPITLSGSNQQQHIYSPTSVNDQQQQQQFSQHRQHQQQQLFLFSASANCTPISPQSTNGVAYHHYNNSQHQYNLSTTTTATSDLNEPAGDVKMAPTSGQMFHEGDQVQHENNCLDYTIIQNSQFQVDSLRTRHQQQQQQPTDMNMNMNMNDNYCYHKANLSEFNVNELKRMRIINNNNNNLNNHNQTDLTNLTNNMNSSMTTAVL